MVEEFCKVLGKKAYLFYNHFIDKYMYFIPLCDYDEVGSDEEFDSDTYSRILYKGKEVLHIKDLITSSLLTGDPRVLIVPEYFDFEDLQYDVI